MNKALNRQLISVAGKSYDHMEKLALEGADVKASTKMMCDDVKFDEHFTLNQSNEYCMSGTYNILISIFYFLFSIFFLPFYSNECKT